MDIKNVRKWHRNLSWGHTNVYDEEKSERPSFSDELWQKLRTSCPKINNWLSKNLHYWFLTFKRFWKYKWSIEKFLLVSKMLMEDHKRQRIMVSREFFECYVWEGDDLLNFIVTGDKTWVYHFIFETYGLWESLTMTMTWKKNSSTG